MKIEHAEAQRIISTWYLPGLRLAVDEINKLIAGLEAQPEAPAVSPKSVKQPAKQPHWTQTPEGKRKQSRRMKQMWKEGKFS